MKWPTRARARARAGRQIRLEAPHEVDEHGRLGRPHRHDSELGEMTLETQQFDVNPGGQPVQQPQLKTRADILAFFDKAVPEARAAIAGASDETMMQPWALLNGGKTVFTMPRVAVLRSMIMNHMVHHRAQLGVYLRLNDLPVPAIYGPSADETGISRFPIDGALRDARRGLCLVLHHGRSQSTRTTPRGIQPLGGGRARRGHGAGSPAHRPARARPHAASAG